MRIAIIGAGAAGCFAAANIPRQSGREVTVLEKTGKALQKVKVSGGGRCNVTHACFDIPELLQRYPRGKQLLRKSLYRFSPQHTIDWFRQRGVMLKTEEDGRMFPVTDDSQTIIDCLWQEMMRQQVSVLYHRSVQSVVREKGQFTLHFSEGAPLPADRVLIACGGFPKEEQYRWITALGHTVATPVPSLFTFNIPDTALTALMGLSVPDAVVKIPGTKFAERGPLLITHWGLSGPAVLRTSAWAAAALHERRYDFRIMVNWLGGRQDEALKEQIEVLRKESGKQFLHHKNPFALPRRLWEYLLVRSGVDGAVRYGELGAAHRNRLTEVLLRDSYEVKGKTTFKEEFVTCGGVSLQEIDPQTMESRIMPGLYFAGEILNVDGITGGYNFQHAWSSGWIAAQGICDS